MADQIGEPDQQADIVAFLETAGALQPGETARRIDTHAARVFLAATARGNSSEPFISGISTFQASRNVALHSRPS